MDEELRKLQELFFTELVGRLNLKPLVTPISPADFPNLDWTMAEKDEPPTAVAHKETQLGFYDMQLPCTTSKPRADRKLSLILDLDQTLVHAMKLNELFSDILCPPPGTVPNEFDKFVLSNFANCTNPKFVEAFTTRINFYPDSLVAPVPGGRLETEPRQLLVTWLENDMYLIKLRPGLRSFIAKLAALYELHIYTKANRNYLNFLINELDPLGKYFTSAVARDDSPDLDIELKVLNRVCCRTMNEIVVFDDRVDIWSESTGNVVRAQPYNFLQLKKMSVIKALEEIVAVSPSAMGEASGIALDFDCHLHYMQEVLVKVHEEFVRGMGKLIVPEIVTRIRKQVLAGMNILFTGFTDLAQFTKEIESFGAVCSTGQVPGASPDESPKEEDPDCQTILVAAKHTKRVHDAKKISKMKVVHGSWLDHCRATWTVPNLAVFDHSRFRVNEDGTYGAIDSWEVAWIAANQHGFSTERVNGDSSELGFAHSITSNKEVKKRRRV